LQREAIEVGRQVLGPETLTVANLVNNLGVTQSLMGRHGEAERLFRSAYETHRSLLGDAHRRTANVARNVGRALALQQRYIEALAWMDRAPCTAQPVRGLMSRAASDSCARSARQSSSGWIAARRR
jgi:Flp pilus assembly protein TadD